MTRFAERDLTEDVLLGGRVRLLQPVSGYRAGIDPVLLAAAVPASPGQTALDLGCGGGVAALCLLSRVPGVIAAGVEVQPAYADLARRNAALNDVAFEVFEADLAALPDTLRQRQFDHVLANPPFFRAGAHSAALDAGRQTAMGEGTPLEAWVDTAARRLKPRGYLHMIQRVDWLPDLLAACAGRLGALEILPLGARAGRAPGLVLLRARKDGRAAFRLHAPLVIHPGPAHVRDGDAYSPEIEAVLRSGEALKWPQ